MTSQKQTIPLQPGGEADTSSYHLVLSIPVDKAPADGKSTNHARVKLTRGAYLEAEQPITFQITQGAAVFGNGTQEIDGPQTDPMGAAWVGFTDATAESGKIVAWMTNHPDVRSEAVPYAFTGDSSPSYALTFSSLTPGGEISNGAAENEGRAVVTENGGPLEQAQIVTFGIENGSALFDVSGQYVVQSSADHRVVYVKTHSENGRDIADASFFDAKPETVTVTASLRDHAGVPSQQQNFEFTPYVADHFTFSLNRIANRAQADGEKQNQANVTVYDNTLPAPDKTRVTFELPAGTAQFASDIANVVGQGTRADGSKWVTVEAAFIAGGGATLAGAGFTDSNGTGETVTLTACLTDHAEVEPQNQDYTFSPESPYVVTITSAPSWLANNVSGTIAGTVVYRQTQEKITGTCSIGYSGPIGGPASVEATNGTFSFDVTGLTVVGKLSVTGHVPVSYGGASDQADIVVYPY